MKGEEINSLGVRYVERVLRRGLRLKDDVHLLLMLRVGAVTCKIAHSLARFSRIETLFHQQRAGEPVSLREKECQSERAARRGVGTANDSALWQFVS